MKILTSFSVIKMSEGLRLSYTYTEINDKTGIATNNNVQESRFLVQKELQHPVQDVMTYIIENFLSEGN